MSTPWRTMRAGSKVSAEQRAATDRAVAAALSYHCPHCGLPMPQVTRPGVLTCVWTGKRDVWTRERVEAGE